MKRWLLLLAIICVVPMVSAAFPTQFIHGYTLESNGSDVNGTINLTAAGQFGYASGKFGNGVDFGGTNSDECLVNTATSAIVKDDESWSVSFWAKTPNTPGAANKVAFSWYIADGSGNSGGINGVYAVDPYTMATAIYDGASLIINSGETMSEDTWHHIVFVYDNPNHYIYIDGVYRATISDEIGGTSRTGSSSTAIGCNYINAHYEGYEGMIDSLYIYDYALDDDSCSLDASCGGEIEDLYGAEGEYDYSAANNVVIAHVLPTDNDHLNDDPVSFQVNITNSNVVNCTVFFNGSGADTVTNFVGGLWNFTESLAEGVHGWLVNCTDGTATNQTDSDDVIVDFSAPDWTINTFASDNSSSFDTGVNDTLVFSDVVDDVYLFDWNLSIYNSSDALMYSNETTNLSSASETLEDVVSMAAWAPGTYTVTYMASDDHTAKKINDYRYHLVGKDLVFETESNTFTIGGKSNFVKNVVVDKEVDRYTFEFETQNSRKSWEYFVACDDVLYDRSHLYPYPSFVCGRHWIDFNIVGMKSFIVARQGDGLIDVTLVMFGKVDKVKARSVGGLNVVNESYTFMVDMDPPLNPANLTRENYNYTWLNASWDDPGEEIWNHTQVYVDDVWYANVSVGWVNISGLIPSTEYNVSLFSVSDIGAKNTTGISALLSTADNSPPVVNGLYHPTGGVTMAENASQLFQLNATDVDGIGTYTWFVDGDSVLNDSNNYTHTTGMSDSGSYTVVVVVNDSYGMESNISWSLTVTDDFVVAETPTFIKPLSGYKNTNFPVVCTNGVRVSNVYFAVDYKINDGSWVNLYNNTLGVGVFDISLLSFNDSVDFRCQAFSLMGASDWYNPGGVVNRSLIPFVELRKIQYGNLRGGVPFQVGLYADLNGSTSVLDGMMFDCDGDEVFDDAWTYEGLDRMSEFSWCVLDSGYRTMSAYFLLDTNESYNFRGCDRLGGEEQCVIVQRYSVFVS